MNPHLPLSSCSAGSGLLSLGLTDAPAFASGLFLGALAPEQLFDTATTAWCPGFYPPEPQICFLVREAGTYTLAVTDSESTDSVMAIALDGVGLYCDDDTAGNYRPSITYWFEPGEYNVYIGTYGQHGSGRFELTATPMPW